MKQQIFTQLIKSGWAVLLSSSFFVIGFTGITLAAEPDPNNAIPIRLDIPSISLSNEIKPVGFDEVVVDGKTYGQWQVLDNLVAWHNLSAKLGEVGNTVLNGHSDVKGKVFQNLEHIEIGDEITVLSHDQSYQYEVTEKIWVQEKNVSVEQRIENAKLIAPTDDERLTLITCAYPGATHRLIVIAHPIGK